MAMAVWMMLMFSAATASVPVKETDNKEEVIITWKAFETNIKRGIQSVIKYVMPTAIRGMSEVNVTGDCESSLMRFALALSRMETWAVKMADASSKMQSGVLEGTMLDFGAYDECLRIKVHASSRKASVGKELFRGRYCMIGFNSPLMKPFPEKAEERQKYYDQYGKPPEWAYDIIEQAGGFMKRSVFWFGLCVPSACSADDLQKIIRFTIKPMGLNVTETDCQVEEPYTWPSSAIASVVVLSFIVVLCAMGTLLDVISRWRRSTTASNVQDDSILSKILKAFSILSNTEKLFRGNGGDGPFSSFHGMRFLSATWIVLGHSYFFTDIWFRKCRSLSDMYESIYRNLPAAIMDNYTLPVGTFFFMSGFLLVHTTWRKLEKHGGKLNMFTFIVHKYWRMTPAIGLMLALIFCMPVIDSGPLWNSTLKSPLQNCGNLWWLNLLYINNFWNTQEYCFVHTWYMAALMQYHIVGVVLLVVFYRWPVIGVLLGSLILMMCSIEVGLLVVWYNYPMPATTIIKDVDLIDDYNSRLYIKPYTHFSSYVIGMVLAYIYSKYHKKKLAPKYNILGWILAVGGGLLSVYGIYGPAEDVSIRVLYIVGHRIGWALSIGWLTYACATGIGGIVNRLLSWNAMFALGQLSYLLYLLHPLVLLYENAYLRERMYCGHREMVSKFLSTLVITLFLAYAGHVAVEMPFTTLERMVFRKGSKLPAKKIENKSVQIISLQSVPNP